MRRSWAFFFEGRPWHAAKSQKQQRTYMKIFEKIKQNDQGNLHVISFYLQPEMTEYFETRLESLGGKLQTRKVLWQTNFHTISCIHNKYRNVYCTKLYNNFQVTYLNHIYNIWQSQNKNRTKCKQLPFGTFPVA